MREGNLKKISSHFPRNVLIFLFFIDKKSFFSFDAKREIEKNLFSSHMRDEKLKKSLLISHECAIFPVFHR